MNILTYKDLDNPKLGGKANSLAKLSQYDINIPNWFVISSDVFINWLNKGNKKEDFEFSTEERNCILSKLSNNKLYAIRSSACVEDGMNNSFAGQFETFLGVPKDLVLKRIKEVFLSAYSDRLLKYSKDKKITENDLIPSVIIQEQIKSEKAGVIFSTNPVTGNLKEIVISAVFGLGSGLVDGSINADVITINKSTKTINKQIVNKTKKYIIINNKITEEKINTNCSVLTDEEIKNLTILATKIHAKNNIPQDIEWAISNNVIYILQSRPITNLKNITNKIDQITTWDNSNIVESYGGIVSPMTYSFIRYAYAEVYKQMCYMFNVPKKIINYNEYTFSHMLGYINGRVYYNLISWYKLLTMLPGYNFNKDFMIQMMGAKEPLSETALKLVEDEKYPSSKYEDIKGIVIGIFSIIKNYLSIKKMTKNFYNNVQDAMDLNNKYKELSTMSLSELAQYYRTIERKLIKKWDAPVINDFFAMIFYGIFRKCSENWVNGKLKSIYNDLLVGDGDIISTKPPKLIKEIALNVVEEIKNKDLDLTIIDTLCKGSDLDIQTVLLKNENISNKINKYIELYGDRCLEELKLETLTMEDAPINLYRTIGNMVQKILTNNIKEIDEESIRNNAENIYKDILSNEKLKRCLYSYIVRETRYFVRNRENLRFERTKIFGLVRKIIKQIGLRFYSLDIIDNPRDIFYLELEEVLGFIEGNGTTNNFKQFIKIRKEDREKFSKIKMPQRFDTFGAVNTNNKFKESIKNNKDVNNNFKSINGISCCPGIVEGIVRIVEDPKHANLKHGEILIAERTDPGWIMLFPIASGVIVEKGSLLSHASIVLREMGIPAIVGCDNITALLKTGDYIKLDASLGLIKKIEKENNDEK